MPVSVNYKLLKVCTNKKDFSAVEQNENNTGKIFIGNKMEGNIFTDKPSGPVLKILCRAQIIRLPILPNPRPVLT